jgi:hypothetical protein
VSIGLSLIKENDALMGGIWFFYFYFKKKKKN